VTRSFLLVLGRRHAVGRPIPPHPPLIPSAAVRRCWPPTGPSATTHTVYRGACITMWRREADAREVPLADPEHELLSRVAADPSGPGAAPARDQLSRQRDIPPGARGFHANSVRTKLASKSRRCVRGPTKELDPVLT